MNDVHRFGQHQFHGDGRCLLVFDSITPGSGWLGSTPTLTVTFPGTPYNGTVEFTISLLDGTGVVSMGTVTVDNHLVNGNQVVVDTLEIPEQLLTFTGYPVANSPNPGASTINGMSTISGMVVGQTITGTNVPADTMITGWNEATLDIQNPYGMGAATMQSMPQTLTVSNGVTITGYFTPSTTQFNVLSVVGWDDSMDLQGLSITGDGLGMNNSIASFTPGEMYVDTVIPTSATPITFTSQRRWSRLSDYSHLDADGCHTPEYLQQRQSIYGVRVISAGDRWLWSCLQNTSPVFATLAGPRFGSGN